MKNNAIKIFIRIFLIFSFCFLGFAIYLTAVTNPAVSHEIEMATTVKKESFTELYFEDHLELPSKVSSNNLYSFKFTIHNLENKDMSYPYEVYADLGGGEKLLIERNTVVLRDNEFKTIEEKFKVADPFTRFKIVINLIDKKQQINFWIEGTNVNK